MLALATSYVTRSRLRASLSPLAASCFAALIAATAPIAVAQTYPTKPIRLIVPFPAGGGTDIVGRAVGQKLSEAWGQQVIVDNRAGGGATIGTQLAAAAAADGYTLLLGTSSGLVVNPLLVAKLPYDPVKDFAPVTMLVINPTILVAHPAAPFGTVKELVAVAKKSPGKLNYASVGQGSPVHLAMELLKSMTGSDLVHIPYKGSTPAVTDLVAGQVQLMFNSIPPVLPLVKAGKLKALAVGSAHRSLAAPELPTVAESGVPGFEAVTWFGVFAPAKTPKDIVTKLNGEIVKILADPTMAQRLASQGAEPHTTTPEGLARYMRDESLRYKDVIRKAGIKIE